MEKYSSPIRHSILEFIVADDFRRVGAVEKKESHTSGVTFAGGINRFMRGLFSRRHAPNEKFIFLSPQRYAVFSPSLIPP